MVAFDFQTVLDAMADAVVASDASDAVTYLNPAAERLLGWSRQELVGQPLTTLMPERMRSAHEAGFRRYMTTRQTRIMGRPVRVPAQRKDGSELDIELTLSLLPVADGREMIVACFRDLRDRVELERQIVAQQRLRAQYEVMVTVAGATTLGEAAPKLLQAVGEQLGWPLGLLWTMEGDRLRLQTSWSKLDDGAAAFVVGSRATSFVLGIGLPGRVWKSGRPAWVADVQADDNFPRAAFAEEAGIRSAFAFPLLGVGGVVGVAEFFGQQQQPPDDELLDTVSTLGRQIGQFLDRIEVERSLRLALASLSESEVRFRTLAEATSQIVWTADAAGHVLSSPSWSAFTGQRPEELVTGKVGDSVHPEDRERSLEKWTAAVERTTNMVTDLRLRRRDGVYVPMLMRAAPVLNSDGTVHEWIGTLTDISDRKRAEDAQRFLTEASTILSSSLEYSTTLAAVARLAVPTLADWCAVEMLKPDGTSAPLAVAHVDPAKVELAGELSRRYPPDPHAPTGLPNVLRTGRPELYERLPESMLVDTAKDDEHLRLIRELGGLHSGIIVPINTPRGTVGAISLVSAESGRHFDRTDLGLAEELARRAAIAIENATLYREARDAIAVRDDFLSIASHELRTPLTSLQLHVSGLRRGLSKGDLAPEKLSSRVATLEHQLDRLGKLVDDLLDVSRAASGRVELQLEEVDLAEVVREVTGRFAEELSAAGCPLAVDVAGSIVGRWDRMRLDQILTNFLSNAIKYGCGKPIEVRASSDGAKAMLAVEDQGLGISEPDQRRIFDRFTRAVPSDQYGGLGLGLWIVRLVVEAMGGSVAVDSRLGQGSTFSATLPLRLPNR